MAKLKVMANPKKGAPKNDLGNFSAGSAGDPSQYHALDPDRIGHSHRCCRSDRNGDAGARVLQPSHGRYRETRHKRPDADARWWQRATRTDFKRCFKGIHIGRRRRDY